MWKISVAKSERTFSSLARRAEPYPGTISPTLGFQSAPPANLINSTSTPVSQTPGFLSTTCLSNIIKLSRLSQCTVRTSGVIQIKASCSTLRSHFECWQLEESKRSSFCKVLARGGRLEGKVLGKVGW